MTPEEAAEFLSAQVACARKVAVDLAREWMLAEIRCLDVLSFGSRDGITYAILEAKLGVLRDCRRQLQRAFGLPEPKEDERGRPLLPPEAPK